MLTYIYNIYKGHVVACNFYDNSVGIAAKCIALILCIMPIIYWNALTMLLHILRNLWHTRKFILFQSSINCIYVLYTRANPLMQYRCTKSTCAIYTETWQDTLIIIWSTCCWTISLIKSGILKFIIKLSITVFLHIWKLMKNNFLYCCVGIMVSGKIPYN